LLGIPLTLLVDAFASQCVHRRTIHKIENNCKRSELNLTLSAQNAEFVLHKEWSAEKKWEDGSGLRAGISTFDYLSLSTGVSYVYLLLLTPHDADSAEDGSGLSKRGIASASSFEVSQFQSIGPLDECLGLGCRQHQIDWGTLSDFCT
jgi:hypothetical protein